MSILRKTAIDAQYRSQSGPSINMVLKTNDYMHKTMTFIKHIQHIKHIQPCMHSAPKETSIGNGRSRALVQERGHPEI